jgi:hypothetical protein
VIISAAILLMSSPALAAVSTRGHHAWHLAHVAHLQHVQYDPQLAVTTAIAVPDGVYSFSDIERLWESAGGPVSAAAGMATIAECESGGNPQAYNPDGASGIFQILGSVVSGNLFDPYVNALNAVAKFRTGGYSPWTCQP